MLTRKENYLRMLRREKYEWIPSLGDLQVFIPHVVPDAKCRAMLLEANPLPPDQWGGFDMFGVEWVFVPVAMGSMEKETGSHMLEDVNDWKEKIKFPDVDSWPWEQLAEENKDYLQRDMFIQTWLYTSMFERLISFMGFEDAACALIDEDQEDAIHELFDALADTYIKIIANFKKYFGIDGIYLHDDWGTQKSSFFSLNVAKTMLVPHLRKIADYCHANGLVYEAHSCGKNDGLIEAYIEAGADQWVGQDMNDIPYLRENYGDKIVVGYNFVHGTKEEIKAQFDKLAAECPDDLYTKPVYISLIMWPEEDLEYLRELSREHLAKQSYIPEEK